MVTSHVDSAARGRVGTAAQAGRGDANRGRSRAVHWTGYLYVLPALAVFIVFLGIPLGQSVWISLWHWDGLTPATWAGFANYADIARNPELLAAFGHTGILIVFYSVLPAVLALALTAVMGRASRMRGVSFFRALLFLPQVIASVVVATMWVSIYAPDGLFNQTLHLFGLKSVSRAWLGDFTWALPAVGLIGTWLGIGLCIVLFVSGQAAVPAELYEAARLDGAGPVREFFAITLPHLRGHIAVALTVTTTSALKTFDLVYVTTHGGPGTSTTVPAYEVYNRAFNTNQVGSATAVGIVLTGVILVLTLVISKIQPKDAA